MTSMVVALAATVLALGGVVWSGIARRRSLHYQLIVVFLAALGVAIWRARVVGSGLRFEGVALLLHRVHMASVVLTFLVLPFLVVSGVRLARAVGPAAADRRPKHKTQAMRFVVLVLVTAVLGTLMTVFATPK
jgi:hypothetical protein